VEHVYSYADIIKRLNKNMHGDDSAWYRIPEDRELAAQYLLLYELSLPFGLDLNDRISVDKSASRVTVSLPEISTKRVREFIARSKTWLAFNAPGYMATEPTGATVMFSHISERNIKSMLTGNALALVLIALVIVFSLRSFRLGVLSLIPNTLPILVTFGLWAILVGRVGMAAATVTSTSLGIIVDDTVHFLAKYLRARREQNLDPPEAVKYAFDTVGQAIVATTIILGIGFSILATSTFLINAHMGLLTALAIAVAFLFDFTLLPVMLLIGHEQKGASYEPVSLPQETY
jgi:predicted RND superfamily exporter protein